MLGTAQPLAWKNGDVLPFADLSLHVSDLGVVAGASVTEMARTFAHKPFRLAEHIQRLLESCEELGFPMVYTAEQLITVAEHIVQENSRLISSQADLGIVAFATAGANRTYLDATELPAASAVIHTFQLPFDLWKPAATKGVRLVIPQRTQVDSSAMPVHRKVRNRLHWWLADQEAQATTPGSRALLLDSAGRITETSNGCFYAVIDNAIVTPNANVLISMSRRIVEEAAANAGMTFSARDLIVSDINQMQEAFVSSTPFGVLSVQSINDTVFESRNPVAAMLNNFWQHLTGINPVKQILSSTT